MSSDEDRSNAWGGTKVYYYGAILLFTGIGMPFSLAGFVLGILAKLQGDRAKDEISAFVAELVPGASLVINTNDLTIAGTLTVVACILTFLWLLMIACIFTYFEKGGGKWHGNYSFYTYPLIVLTLWILGAVIAATVIYATKGPTFQGTLPDNTPATYIAILNWLIAYQQSRGVTLSPEYKNRPQKLVRSAIVIQWFAWLFATIVAIFLLRAVIKEKKRKNAAAKAAAAGRGPVSNFDPPPPAATGSGNEIEEKNRNEGSTSAGLGNTATNSPYGVMETEKVTRSEV
ncbi:hypothetical protein CVT24_008164 [Panaeolus cyanescens]|uniref:Uncharacterized protein n=1 Tax=Panaeolus cyanescens TaxID=181874 RepID=A0A409VFE7_9AGAR|nr:hypothetical protein CVT24_008164 [Panaeolus cyanescens]